MLLWGTAYSRSYLHIGAWSFYKSIFFLLYDRSLVAKSPLQFICWAAGSIIRQKAFVLHFGWVLIFQRLNFPLYISFIRLIPCECLPCELQLT